MIEEVLVNDNSVELKCSILHPSIDDSNRIERIMKVSEFINNNWKLDNIDTIVSEDGPLIIYYLKK